MSCLCCWIIFWTTQYNSPHTFCLASYSVMFHDRCTVLLQPTNHWHCIRALRCDPSNQYTTLSHTNWLIGYIVKHSTTCLLSTRLPFLAEHKRAFFPLLSALLLRPPVAEWSLPRGSEQACLPEPLLALVCRHSSFGCITTVILRRRQAAYRMINHP